MARTARKIAAASLSRKSSSVREEQSGQWVPVEFASADLGDGRLNKRLMTIAEAFSSMPNGSIPEACKTWDQTKGAYRFLNNSKVSPEKILAPHQLRTQERIAEEKVVLAIQDTTTLNYTSHPETEGLGPISTGKKNKGMLLHTTLAFTPERVSLGLIQQLAWVRDEEEYGRKHLRKERSIEEKESIRWLNSLAATEKVQRKSPGTLIINIGDREADIYELFQQAAGCQCHLLVRSSWNRRVKIEDEEDKEKLLWPYLESQPCAGTQRLEVPRKGKQPKRIADIEIRHCSVTLDIPSHKKNRQLSPVTLWAVLVSEPSAPEGAEPLCWRLLTTLRVETLEDALRCVEYYSVRFTIELFHKILKSGCRVEERQLESAEGLMNCLALDSVVAWRVLFLTMIGRAVPDLPCTALFDEEEWQPLYCFVHETTDPPSEPPSLGEAIRLLARLGGFLGRKGDGHPGAIVLWRGLQKLAYISVAWALWTTKRNRHPADDN